MTKSGLLTKYEALEKVEEILKTFEEEVYKELNCTNENDTKIRTLFDETLESVKKTSNVYYSYKDVVLIFSASKKLAEGYKLSWLKRLSTENRKIENEKLRLLNLGTGLSELNFNNSDDIQYIQKLEEEDFKELLNLTPQKDRIYFSNVRTGFYPGQDRTYVDICDSIDGEVHALALLLGLPLQEIVSDGLNAVGNFCMEHNKIYFFGVPWLIGKGLKKGGKVLSEKDIPSLKDNIVFTKKVLDSLSDTYFTENKEFKKNVINDSIKELSLNEQSEIKKFIKSDDYESFKNEIIFKIDINELKENDLQGYFYNEEKKKFAIKSPGFTPQNLFDIDSFKDGLADYSLNLFKNNIFEIDMGTNLGKDFKIGNMFNVNLADNEKTAKEFSFLISELGDFFNKDLDFKDTIKQKKDHFWNATKETKAEASDFISISKGNTAVSAGVTVSTDGLKETIGVKNVLYEKEKKKVTLTNTGTTKQELNGSLSGLEFKTEINNQTKQENIVSKVAFKHKNEKKAFLTSFGFSVCLSELQRKTYISSEDALLQFGITYTKPDITKNDNSVTIKTTLKVGDSSNDFHLGFQLDTGSGLNSKIILTYNLRDL